MPTDLELIETQDGSHSLLSRKYGVPYHSKYGAIQESRHVFIQEGLLPLLVHKQPLEILEMGFGSGLNAFLTFLETVHHRIPVYYEAVEAYPIRIEQAAALNYSTLLGGGAYADIFLALHDSAMETETQISPYFTLKKRLGEVQHIPFHTQYDLVYYHAFTPEAQPEMWEMDTLAIMYEALKKGGILVTFSAKGEVKRRLKALGFELEILKGPPGKREMLRALKP